MVWYRDVAGTPTPTAAQHIAVLKPLGRFLSTFTAAELSNGDLPHVGARLTISETDGTLVTFAILDAEGKARLDLQPGDYIASVTLTGVVYTTNNFECAVVDTTVDAGNNQFILMAEKFSPTLTEPSASPNSVTLYLDLFGMDGRPFPNAQVTVTMVNAIQVLTGNTVWDTHLTYCTDGNGHVEFDLLQGIDIEVSITPLSVRRQITTPSGVDAVNPVNLATLLSAADDPFDILNITVPSAPSRSL